MDPWTCYCGVHDSALLLAGLRIPASSAPRWGIIETVSTNCNVVEANHWIPSLHCMTTARIQPLQDARVSLFDTESSQVVAKEPITIQQSHRQCDERDRMYDFARLLMWLALGPLSGDQDASMRDLIRTAAGQWP